MNEEVKAKEIPQEENEEEYKERASQNLMKNVNSEKLKQLLDANVGGGPYSEAVLERKKHSFELLKQWDDAKCGLLQAHRSALEMFAKKIDKKQAFLKNAMFTIKSFFEQRLQQENTYIEFSLKKIPKIAGIYAESGENPEKTSVFPQISQSFAQIDAFVAENAEKHAKTAEFLEKTLLQALIYPEIANYEAVLLRVRDEIVENRRQIARISKEIGEISSSHARFFTETLQKTRPKAAETQDFYDSEVKLLGVSQEQVRLQRLLATNTIKFYREWEKLEENRVKTLQNAMKTYAKFSETHANRDNPAQIPGNLASSLENWDFEDDLLRFLDLEEKSQEIFACFFSLEDIKLPEIEISPLIVKEFVVERLEEGILGKSSSKSAKIVITVDNNLLIFDDFLENRLKPANFVVKIENLQVKRRTEPLVVELREKVKGLIWDSTKSYVFRVENTDIYDEIIIYLDFIKLRKWI